MRRSTSSPLRYHGWSAQANLPGQSVEDPVDLADVQAVATPVHEQQGRHGSTCPTPLASPDIVTQHLASRRVQGNQPRFAKLGSVDRQHGGIEVDVVEFEVARFANAQPGDG
jgi:hypothetical protein